MVGCCKENQRDVWSLPPSDYAVWNARSMTDWVMQAVQSGIHNLSTSSPQDGNPWNIRVWDKLTGIDVDNAVDKKELTGHLRTLLSVPAEGNFDDWTAQQTGDSAPIKTSVSALAKKAVTGDALPLSDAEEDADTKRVEEEIVSPLRLSELPSRPAFLEEKQLTGAERGTLMHRALSLIPLDTLRDASDLDGAVKQAIHDLAEREIFTYQEVMLLSIQGIAGFFRSDLGQRMLRSGTVRREWAFNLVMDERGTLLQGVIDCAFREEGGWVLVDYKTDRIEDEDAFIQRYQLQMEWYAKALERITGLPVKEQYLYALGKAKAYSL